MIMAKWIGLTPISRMIGKKIGTRMISAAVVSMKVPTMSKRMLISSRITILLLLRPRTDFAIMSGMRLAVST